MAFLYEHTFFLIWLCVSVAANLKKVACTGPLRFRMPLIFYRSQSPRPYLATMRKACRLLVEIRVGKDESFSSIGAKGRINTWYLSAPFHKRFMEMDVRSCRVAAAQDADAL